MQAEGRLDAAQAELGLRRERLVKLKSLFVDGHARQEEILRAEAEVAVAEANVRTAREDLLTRKLEYDKLRIQYERRTVRTPVAGVVTMVHKQPGEFVAPNKPDVVTLVDLDSLLANFTVMGPQAEKMHVGDKIKVFIAAGNLTTEGLVEFVAPVTDAESGTVRVKIRIENSAGRFRSGERCKIRI
jgi:multidrug efflux pump subunit AcrA (membrane-fusion protein)